jgi:hypothetical protein
MTIPLDWVKKGLSGQELVRLKEDWYTKAKVHKKTALEGLRSHKGRYNFARVPLRSKERVQQKVRELILNRFNDLKRQLARSLGLKFFTRINNYRRNEEKEAILKENRVSTPRANTNIEKEGEEGRLPSDMPEFKVNSTRKLTENSLIKQQIIDYS